MYKYKYTTRKFFIFSLIIVSFYYLKPNYLIANDQINNLSNQINQYEIKLQQINKEIEENKLKLNSASNRSKTLSNNLKELEATKKKLESEIIYTQNQISKIELTLNRVQLEIEEKNKEIQTNSNALSQTIRRMNDIENMTLVEKFLGYKDMSEFWNELDQAEKIQKKFHTEINNLSILYDELKKKELENINQKNQLANQKVTLAGEKESVQYTQKEKEVMLNLTKNEEANYQKILKEKIAIKESFEKEILDIESKLRYLIDPNSYPKARRGVINWPVDNIIITQKFGGTEFAKTNPGIYGRAYHPGLDFGVSIGTKVKTVLEGVVKGTGNTDAYPGCNAWGKWILIEHNNGLTTLYAHLSDISVVPDQKVESGQVIGFSGNTGVSTGPHLHLTLYATQGVKIGKYSDFKSGSGCAATDASGPFADLNAYLDPEEYLPNK